MRERGGWIRGLIPRTEMEVGRNEIEDILPANDKYGGPLGYLNSGVGEGGGEGRLWRVGSLGSMDADAEFWLISTYISA
jgi:hypothetical protein